jgi:hypothetical protein
MRGRFASITFWLGGGAVVYGLTLLLERLGLYP